jgi:hypothetical protein
LQVNRNNLTEVQRSVNLLQLIINCGTGSRRMALESGITDGSLEGAKGSPKGSQGGGWRFTRRMDEGEASLSEVHASIPVPRQGLWLRRLLAFSGPGYMVSVGYMDPGN